MDFLDNVKRARSGDADAFAQLYSTVYKDMYYIAVCNLKNGEDAADAVSETVLDAIKGIRKLRDPEAFKGWIYKILMTKIKRIQSQYMLYRQNSVLLSAEKEQIDEENRYEEMEIIHQLETLSDDEKLCFSLFAVCGYTGEDISRLTGIKHSTVRSHLLRGREKLKKQLSNN